MGRRNREQELAKVLRKYVDVFDIEHNRKSGHYCITIYYLGQSRKLFTGSTPSDKRSLKNFESDVRRMLRDIEQSS